MALPYERRWMLSSSESAKNSFTSLGTCSTQEKPAKRTSAGFLHGIEEDRNLFDQQ